MQRYRVPGSCGLMPGGCSNSHLGMQILGLLFVQSVRMSYKIKSWGKFRRSFKKSKTLQRTDIGYHLFIISEFLMLLVVDYL